MFEGYPDLKPTLSLITAILLVVTIAAFALGLVPMR